MASLQVFDDDADIAQEDVDLVTIEVFQPLVHKVRVLHEQHRLNTCPVQVQVRASEREGSGPQLQLEAIRIR